MELCFQCGKERIIVKVYSEYINGSKVTTTQSICSDPKCQEKTERDLEKERLRRESNMSEKSKADRYRQASNGHKKITL